MTTTITGFDKQEKCDIVSAKAKNQAWPPLGIVFEIAANPITMLEDSDQISYEGWIIRLRSSCTNWYLEQFIIQVNNNVYEFTKPVVVHTHLTNKYVETLIYSHTLLVNSRLSEVAK